MVVARPASTWQPWLPPLGTLGATIMRGVTATPAGWSAPGGQAAVRSLVTQVSVPSDGSYSRRSELELPVVQDVRRQAQSGGTWRAVAELAARGPAAAAVAESLSTAVVRARAPSTVSKYSSWTARFSAFRSSTLLLSGGAVPSSPAVVAMWVAALAQEGLMPGTLEGAVSAVAWAHRVAAEPDPTTDAIVRLALDGAKRMNARPSQHMDEFTVPQIQQIVSDLVKKPRMQAIRTAAMLVVAFSCLLRPAELLALRRQDLSDETDGIQVVIRAAKNDQLHLSTCRFVPVLPGELVCPATVLRNYLLRLDSFPRAVPAALPGGGPLWPNLRGGEAGEPLWDSALAYDPATRALRAACDASGVTSERLTWHSCRSGGATAAYDNGAAPLTVQALGAWRSDTFERYVRHNKGKLLQASRVVWAATGPAGPTRPPQELMRPAAPLPASLAPPLSASHRPSTAEPAYQSSREPTNRHGWSTSAAAAIDMPVEEQQLDDDDDTIVVSSAVGHAAIMAAATASKRQYPRRTRRVMRRFSYPLSSSYKTPTGRFA